jgi:thiol-disulfide isomerase/thioredoxin
MVTDTQIPPRPGSGAARRAKAAKRKQHSGRRNPLVVIGGLVLIVAAALLVAVVAGGDDPAETVEPGIQQTRPVEVSGETLPVRPSSGADPAIGMVAPSISGATFDGRAISLPASGSPTLSIFVAHWCPHCQKEVPLLTEWKAAGLVPDGVEVYAVSTGVDPNSVNYPPSEWLEREAFPFAVIVDSADGDAAKAMGVDGYPYFLMTDADGKVLWRTSGEVPTESLTQMIDESLGLR